MPVGSPTVPGLTSPRALHSRVLQASSASEDVRQVLRELLDFVCVKERFERIWSESSIFGVHQLIRVVFRVLLRLHRGYEVLKPRICLGI